MLLVDIFEIINVERDYSTTRYISIAEVMDFDEGISVKWNTEYNTDYGYYNIEGKEYRAFIELATYPNPIVSQAAFVNIGFMRKDHNGDWILTSNSDSTDNNSFGVISTAAYNISKRLQDHYSSLDAVIFGMTTSINKRSKVYSYTANKILKNWPGTIVVNGLKTTNGVVSIIFMPHISENSRAAFIDYVKQLTQHK